MLTPVKVLLAFLKRYSIDKLLSNYKQTFIEHGKRINNYNKEQVVFIKIIQQEFKLRVVWAQMLGEQEISPF